VCYVLPSATAAFRFVFLSVLFIVVLYPPVSFLFLMQPPVELVHNGKRWGRRWSIRSGRSPSRLQHSGVLITSALFGLVVLKRPKESFTSGARPS